MTRGQPLSLAGSLDGKNFLYVHGNSVIIRSFDSPQYSDVYTQYSYYAEKGDRLKMHYTGTLREDGSEFNSSIPCGDSLSFMRASGTSR